MYNRKYRDKYQARQQRNPAIVPIIIHSFEKFNQKHTSFTGKTYFYTMFYGQPANRQ